MSFQNFYTILGENQQSAETITYSVRINKEHQIFKGHFPKTPVTPGVGMLQIIKDLTEKHTGRTLFMKEVAQVKFLSVVDPGVTPELYFELHFNVRDELVLVKNYTSTPQKTAVLKCNVTFVTE
jgi:3-hydroxyacyl-[acyl-carrier-protein] dehydratase